MADKYNLVSAELTSEAAERVAGLIGELQGLMPFLIALTKDTRSTLVWPGAAGLEAAGAMAETVAKRPGLFPADVVDAAELKRDVALARALGPIRDGLAGLLQGVEDTLAGAGSDAYRAALRAYALAQVIKSTTPGLEAEMAPLAGHLDRPRRG